MDGLEAMAVPGSVPVVGYEAQAAPSGPPMQPPPQAPAAPQQDGMYWVSYSKQLEDRLKQRDADMQDYDRIRGALADPNVRQRWEYTWNNYGRQPQQAQPSYQPPPAAAPPTAAQAAPPAAPATPPQGAQAGAPPQTPQQQAYALQSDPAFQQLTAAQQQTAMVMQQMAETQRQMFEAQRAADFERQKDTQTQLLQQKFSQMQAKYGQEMTRDEYMRLMVFASNLKEDRLKSVDDLDHVYELMRFTRGQGAPNSAYGPPAAPQPDPNQGYYSQVAPQQQVYQQAPPQQQWPQNPQQMQQQYGYNANLPQQAPQQYQNPYANGQYRPSYVNDQGWGQQPQGNQYQAQPGYQAQVPYGSTPPVSRTIPPPSRASAPPTGPGAAPPRGPAQRPDQARPMGERTRSALQDPMVLRSLTDPAYAAAMAQGLRN